jgi:SAM-dependent methyltransferase
VPTTRHDRAKGVRLDAFRGRLTAAEAVLSAAGSELARARAARDALIAEAAAAGLSLRQIGESTGLSAQRVQQLISSSPAVFDRIGTTYTSTRREDPRLRAAIWAAIGDAAPVVNVGAGAGAYEPPATVLAIEPSLVMIAQRRPDAAPVLLGSAERIPLPDGFAGCALVTWAVHHFGDLEAAVGELRRIAERVVIVTWSQPEMERFWLLSEYLPEIAEYDRGRTPSIERLVELLGAADVRVLPIGRDCVDGFLGSYWQRPAAYLDAGVRAGISAFQAIGHRAAPGLARLADDLSSGAWHARHADLLDRDEIDLGYRILVA